MILIPGGTFAMGDPFGEGSDNERPVHEVRLSDFYLAPHEVTVGEFRQFVEAADHVTSAENAVDEAATAEIMKSVMTVQGDRTKLADLHRRILEYGGAGHWNAEARRWEGYNPHTNWRNPGFEQADDHPVVAVSWDDAITYCNWLSRAAGLPPAYDLPTGAILDGHGHPADTVGAVRGYRLPTEAEWEYAARERGCDVRFGNGRNVAQSSEINFRGDNGGYAFLARGEYRKRTVPVGSFAPNGLGLFDMSGNAWEWVSDNYAEYGVDPLSDPYVMAGDKRILRGGGWGHDAVEIRATHRSAWPRNDRCNQSGFRIAKTAPGGPVRSAIERGGRMLTCVTRLLSVASKGVLSASMLILLALPVFGQGAAAEILFWPTRLDSYSGY